MAGRNEKKTIVRVPVKPKLLRWARRRARLSAEDLRKRFPKLESWERGELHPTMKQLTDYSRATFTPVGFMFLDEIPAEDLPIPDFRSGAGGSAHLPTPNLLDMIHLCQQRQSWYRDALCFEGEKHLDFVGSVDIRSSVVSAAARIRDALGFNIEERRQIPNWTEALRRFIAQSDRLGILVMVSGVVGSNNRRKLDPGEFRGFALVDPQAPLVFINGADSKAAQMFTLAHELAHVWLGKSALSDADARDVSGHRVEEWCNRVAAELLAPMEAVRNAYRPEATLSEEINRLARLFKVSSLVMLRRVFDLGALNSRAYWQAYDEELKRIRALPSGKGGDFYLTLGSRVSRTFARALVVSTLEGRTSFAEAFRLLGFKQMNTFDKLGRSLGVIV